VLDVRRSAFSEKKKAWIHEWNPGFAENFTPLMPFRWISRSLY